MALKLSEWKMVQPNMEDLVDSFAFSKEGERDYIPPPHHSGIKHWTRISSRICLKSEYEFASIGLNVRQNHHARQEPKE